MCVRTMRLTGVVAAWVEQWDLTNNALVIDYTGQPISPLPSMQNFIKAGYVQCEPEQPWEQDSVYWVKAI